MRKECMSLAIPTLNGRSLPEVIHEQGKVVVIAMPTAGSTKEIMDALQSQSVPYAMEEFHVNGTYKSGESAVWDWLHCNFPEEADDSMPSYVFSSGEFLGQGVMAAQKIRAGRLNMMRTPRPKAHMASVVVDATHSKVDLCAAQEKLAPYRNLVSNDKPKYVLIFGSEKDVDSIDAKFKERRICTTTHRYAGPWEPQISFLQCRQGDSGLSSFVYVPRKAGRDTFEYVFKGQGMGDGFVDRLLKNGTFAFTDTCYS